MSHVHPYAHVSVFFASGGSSYAENRGTREDGHSHTFIHAHRFVSRDGVKYIMPIV